MTFRDLAGRSKSTTPHPPKVCASIVRRYPPEPIDIADEIDQEFSLVNMKVYGQWQDQIEDQIKKLEYANVARTSGQKMQSLWLDSILFAVCAEKVYGNPSRINAPHIDTI